MDKVKLNNFILWCKNWYQPMDKKMDIITQAKKILVLDEYLPCNNPISIALIFIDELVEKGIIKPISLFIHLKNSACLTEHWTYNLFHGQSHYHNLE